LSTETSMLSKSNIQFMSNKEDNELAGSIPYGDIRSVVIPNTVKSIGERAFANNKITSVVIESADTVISNSAFLDNPLKSVIIEGVEQITGE
ncbi:MAG: leucine-rich repeat domain-containing protein, partial [Firmicutes bacterium]|nr:leucine-rich repeat domain-containing protein [Bacillota bacterium]